MKWEYYVEKYDESPIDDDTFLPWLCDMGDEGWELIHVSHSLRTYIFKRPRTEGPVPTNVTED